METFLRFCVRPRSKTTRFAIDSLFSPVIYRLIDYGTITIDDVARVVNPVLNPAVSKKAVDLHHLEMNIRFRSWIRQSYLRKKFGSSFAVREAETKFLAHMTMAPRLIDLQSVFKVGKWNRKPTEKENYEQTKRVAIYEAAQKNKDYALLAEWKLEDLLETIGCCVVGMNAFNWYCEKHFIYEFFTKEYIDNLGKYLSGSMKKIANTKPDCKEITILELGAGNGQLSYFLRDFFNQKPKKRADVSPFKVNVIAIDSGSWKAKAGTTRDIVQKMDFREALVKFKPDIVLCSWMPLGEDWTAGIRKCESVSEYVLIGEIDDGCCGHPWKTWGKKVGLQNDPMFAQNKGNTEQFTEGSIDIFHWLGKSSSVDADKPEEGACKDTPPFESDGFVRQDLTELAQYQLSRYDREQYAANSHTVSFVRQAK